ncbi:MAG: hypothetical protein K2P81_15185 [Bacteriovoracaceae bacterium]|nr:hypothetical protein [Bacteriovoracaceae bacterium]
MKNLASYGADEKLVAEYENLISEAISEVQSSQKTHLNIGKLNARLQILTKAAAIDGLPEPLINELIDRAIPAIK